MKADIPANANAEQYAKAIADATESLKAELAKVAKREDFSALVKQMSEDEFAAKDGFVGYKSGDYLGGMVGRALEAKVVQGVFGPEDFPDGRVVAVWIGAVDKGQQMTLDDYRNETKVHVLREMENERTDELIAKVRGEIGLTIHVPPLAP